MSEHPTSERPTSSERLTAVLRTVVPALWGSAVHWLAQRNLLPAEAAPAATALGDELVDVVLWPLIVGTYYSLMRWLESRRWMPRWAVRILLGSAKTPTYDTVKE